MKRSLALLLLAALFVLPACSNGPDAAASVNGHDISADTVLKGVKAFGTSPSFVAQLSQQGIRLDPDKRAPASFTAQWLTSLMQESALRQIAAKRKVTASDQEIAQARQQFAAGQSAQLFGELPKWLQNEIVATSALQLALRSSLPGGGAQAAYKQLAADCPSKKLIGHILVSTQAEAQAVVDQLKKGDSFASVSNQVSTDTGAKAQGGLLMCEGSSQWSQLDQTFRTAAEAVPVGQISAPVQTQFGFHVIEALPLTPENAAPLLASIAQQQDPLAPIVTRFLDKAKLWVNPRFGRLDRSSGTFQIVTNASPTPKSRPASTPSTTNPAAGSGTTSGSQSQRSTGSSSTTEPPPSTTPPTTAP